MPEGDERGEFQKDRDRLLYSRHFLRLTSVTQVVSSNGLHLLQNRLTHSLRVAQVGRRIAETLLRRHRELEVTLSPDVVEAACLAHDLGHPPYGHVGEEILSKCLRENGEGEGYEGNAQSFRIVTRLEPRHMDAEGLDLTRATLRAILKYPRTWPQACAQIPPTGKFGVYSDDQPTFDWVMEEFKRGKLATKSLEADLMDLADDITYATHDLEDFVRAGRIPQLSLLTQVGTFEYDGFLEGCTGRKKQAEAEVAMAFLREQALPARKFDGSRESDVDLKNLNSTMVSSLLSRVQLKEGLVDRRHSDLQAILDGLKQVTWHFVILNPGLRVQQVGHERQISQLFNEFLRAAKDSADVVLFPPNYASKLKDNDRFEGSKARIVADFISGLTEQQIQHYHRLLFSASEAGGLGNSQWV